MKKRSLFGIFIFLVGIILLLGSLNIIDSGVVFKTYWPLFLIVIGLINIIDKNGPHLFGMVLLILGIIFQLKELSITFLSNVNIFELIWPTIIIMVGLWLIFASKNKNNKVTLTNSVDNVALFSGADIVNESSDFSGGQLTSIFGGIDVNLRKAKIKDNKSIAIDVFVAFGGIDIVVPEDWKVELKGIPLFGGWSNKTLTKNDSQSEKILILNCFIIFGGLEVKN